MLRCTWSRGLGWNDLLPADMTAVWAKWEDGITAQKSFTVPRYIGRQLAVRLAKTVCEQLDLSMRDVKYLSDSTTALWWIYGEPRNFSLFVANRVAEVLTESDPTQWHHVRTQLNVADLETR